MASYLFSEPFYTLSDFDRLFDDAFNARQQGPQPSGRSAQSGSLARRESSMPTSPLSALRPK